MLLIVCFIGVYSAVVDFPSTGIWTLASQVATGSVRAVDERTGALKWHQAVRFAFVSTTAPAVSMAR